MLPSLIQRELGVAARAPGTYNLRLALGGLGLLATVVLLGSVGMSGMNRGGAGTWVFSLLISAMLLVAWGEGTALAADAIWRERKEGTLGFLFLTDLRPLEVILGKLAAGALRTGYGLVAMAPYLFIPLLLGGVHASQVALGFLATLNAAFVAVCGGVWVSSSARADRQPFGRAFLQVSALWLLPPVVGLGLGSVTQQGWIWVVALASPLSPWSVAVSDGTGRWTPSAYWWGLLVSHLAGWVQIGLAAAALKRGWRSEPGESRVSARPWLRLWSGEKKPGIRLGDADPIAWISGSLGGERWTILAVIGMIYGAWGAMGAVGIWMGTGVGVGLAEGWVVFLIASWVVRFGVAAQAARWVAESRSNGALELLAVSPLSTEAVLVGHKKSVWATWKGVVWFVGLTHIIVGFMSLMGPHGSDMGALIPLMLFFYQVAAWFLDLEMLFYASTWNALVSGNANRSAARAIIWFQILPGILFCVPGILLSIPLAFWFRNRFLTRFRSLITNPLDASSSTRPWWRMRNDG